MAAGGAEAAIEAADIALMDGELDRILFTPRLSRQTLRIIAQNHWFAVTTDLISAMLAICANSGPLVVLSPEGGRRSRVGDDDGAIKEGGGYYQLASPTTDISPQTGIIPSDGSCSPT